MPTGNLLKATSRLHVVLGLTLVNRINIFIDLLIAHVQKLGGILNKNRHAEYVTALVDTLLFKLYPTDLLKTIN